MNRHKSSWWQGLLISNAYAHPVIGALIAVIFTILVLLLVFWSIYRILTSPSIEDSFYKNLYVEITSRVELSQDGEAIRTEDLIESLTHRLTITKRYIPIGYTPIEWLLPRNNRTSATPFLPCVEEECPHAVGENPWFRCVKSLIEISADDPEALTALLDYFDKFFLAHENGLRIVMLESLYRLVNQIRRTTSHSGIQDRADNMRTEILKKPYSWYADPLGVIP